MRTLLTLLATLFFAHIAAAQKTVSFPTQDAGVIFADIYGTGDRAIVLVHGGRFNKESWAPQASTLQQAGFQVLALDFRGYGKSHGPGDSDPLSAPLHLDVLAAVRYLHKNGAKTVSVIGGSPLRKSTDSFCVATSSPPSTVGAPQCSPTRKRWDHAKQKGQSAGGAIQLTALH